MNEHIEVEESSQIVSVIFLRRGSGGSGGDSILSRRFVHKSGEKGKPINNHSTPSLRHVNNKWALTYRWCLTEIFNMKGTKTWLSVLDREYHTYVRCTKPSLAV